MLTRDRRSIALGSKFGFWKVTGWCKVKKQYEVTCICGNISHVSVSSLKSGVSKSCGCKQKFTVGEKIIKNNYLSLRRKIYQNYARAAERRGYDFDLSLEDFTNLILADCRYCGAEPSMTYKYGRGTWVALDYSLFKYNGVDRVDNSKGYTAGNVVACCKICNNAKSTLTYEEWFDWINRVHIHLHS